MRSPIARLAGLLASLSLLATGLAVPAGPAVGAPGTARILLLGDSVTQGSVGDWTWRYRLWRHLQAAGTQVDFVGPDTGLWDDGDGTSQAYADPAFDRDHAAFWGRFAGSGEHLVGDLVTGENAGVVVVMLGVNDLIYGTGEPAARAAGVADSLRRLVLNAQRADPDVDVVLGEVTQSWFGRGVRELNAMLPELAAELTTPASTVVVARAAAGYATENTYDTSHPAASGEVLIAAAVADALAGLGIGTAYPRPVAAVPAVPRSTAALTVTSGDGVARLRWTSPPGATSELLWHRDVTLAGSWERLGPPLTGTSVDVAVVNHHVHKFRLQARKGTQTSELFSAAVSVRPMGPEAGPGPAPGAVRDLAVRSVGRHRAAVRWRPAARATSYVVRWAQRGRPRGERTLVTRSTAVRLTRLVPGRRYRVVVRARRAGVTGPARTVTVRTLR